MNNAQLAAVFEEIADLLEFQGANSFRVRAYRNAARTLTDLPEQAAAIDADPKKSLMEIPGIGADLAEKIQVLLNTGRLEQLDDLRSQVPGDVLAMLRIPGLGPKKAAALHKELGVQNLDQLRAACEAEQVRKLKGFGEKTEALILKGLSLAATANDRMLWATADKIAQTLKQHLKTAPGLQQIELAGSYRRGKETIGDLDILVESTEPAAVMDRLAEFPQVADVIGRGDTKMSVRIAAGGQSFVQVDLRVVPGESFGAALQYFTGSKEHNVVLRGMAKDQGLKINEYGVFRGEQSIAGRTEQDVYAAVGMPYFPPEVRENRKEFAWAAAGPLPKLIEQSDLLGDLHMHTTATDGSASLADMAAAAQARGLRYIAITDHSKRVTMANGLDGARLLQQWAEIDQLNQQFTDFRVLKGVECDILERGGLDIEDEFLQQADWVVVSVHYGQKQPRDQITRRIVDALANPHVCALAHPTGRLINHREPYEVDLEAVFAAAKQHRKFLELNSSPMRLDLDDVHCAAAKAHGIPIVISTDAHSIDGLAASRYGVLQARRAGLTPSDVANTLPWPDLLSLLGR